MAKKTPGKRRSLGKTLVLMLTVFFLLLTGTTATTALGILGSLPITVTYALAGAIGVTLVIAVTLALLLVSRKPIPTTKQPTTLTSPATVIPFSSRPTARPDVQPIADQPTAPQPAMRPAVQRVKQPTEPRPETFLDEGEDEDVLLKDFRQTSQQLRWYHTLAAEGAPHMEATPAEPDTRPTSVVYTPFADEAEMREAIENSTVLHVVGESPNKRNKGYPQSRNHGNGNRKRTNRGGGNRRKYDEVG